MSNSLTRAINRRYASRWSVVVALVCMVVLAGVVTCRNARLSTSLFFALRRRGWKSKAGFVDGGRVVSDE